MKVIQGVTRSLCFTINNSRASDTSHPWKVAGTILMFSSQMRALRQRGFKQPQNESMAEKVRFFLTHGAPGWRWKVERRGLGRPRSRGRARASSSHVADLSAVRRPRRPLENGPWPETCRSAMPFAMTFSGKGPEKVMPSQELPFGSRKSS